VSDPALTTVFITLGSNIEPHANLRRAFGRLAEVMRVEAVSGVWESEAHGAPGAPRFLNAAVRASTDRPPESLKRLLRRIESELGRRRSADRNAPRTIDLDIALFGDRVIDDPRAGLRIPDPEILQRPYLALPLAEVGPNVQHPETGDSLGRVAARLATVPGAARRVQLEVDSARALDS
jgi:2-amino-4-hydroxy-6-hydroxymethyldihydropteridine diphosphokinase